MVKIGIKGVIIDNDDKWIYDIFDMDATSPRDVTKALENARGEPITVEIASGGGSVFAGSEIYSALKAHTGNVTVQIIGIAASAASVIAMAGDQIEMSPTAQLMIHNVSVQGAGGDYRDLEKTAEIIKNANTTISNAYQLRTGKTQAELLALMDAETWMTAQQAKESGFIDKVMFDDSMQLVASGFGNMIPKEIINKMQNEKLERKMQDKKLKADAKIKIMRLRGGIL